MFEFSQQRYFLNFTCCLNRCLSFRWSPCTTRDEGPEDSLLYTLNNSSSIISSVLSPCLFSPTLGRCTKTQRVSWLVLIKRQALRCSCRAAFMALERAERETETALSCFVVLMVKKAGGITVLQQHRGRGWDTSRGRIAFKSPSTASPFLRRLSFPLPTANCVRTTLARSRF